MASYILSAGRGRTKVKLAVYYMGEDMVIMIYNEKAHIGAVAVAEYDHKEERASTSLITRLGHKDDVVAQNTAYLISKHTKKPVCVVAGIHLDNISEAEVEQIVANCSDLTRQVIDRTHQVPQ